MSKCRGCECLTVCRSCVHAPTLPGVVLVGRVGVGGGAFWRSSTARRGCRCAVTVPGLAVNAAGARARWARSPLRVVLDRGRSLRVLLPADDDARSFNGGQCVGARHTCCTHAVIWYDGSGGDSAQRCEIRDGLATESGWWQKWPG